MAIPKITKDIVIKALEYIDKHPEPKANKSDKYHLIRDGKRYSPKYVIAVARHLLATHEEISTDGFNVVEAKNWLSRHGFKIATEEKLGPISPSNIEVESNETKKFQLDTEKVDVPIRRKKIKAEKTLVKLTLANVAKVETMIKNDSAYIRASSPTAGPSRKKKKVYSGSTPFWMSLLKQALEDSKWTSLSRYGSEFDREKTIGFTFAEIIAGAIVAVDRDNSTHLTGDGVGRIEIWNRIREIGPCELKNRLKRRDFKLVGEIMAVTDPGTKDTREQLNTDAREFLKHKWLFDAIQAKSETKKADKEFKARTNQSFASKFCHYACLYVFKGENAADNFSIYDTILEKVLPWYWCWFDVGELKKIQGKFNYEEYSAVIDEIRNKNSKHNPDGYLISRNGLDHLLWYYHKGRLDLDPDLEEDPTP